MGKILLYGDTSQPSALRKLVCDRLQKQTKDRGSFEKSKEAQKPFLRFEVKNDW